MPEDKNGFVLYKDLIHTVKKMPKDKQAELFMHILEYVNDLNPQTDDLLIELTFEPIKQSLKRDLRKYQKTKEKNRENALKRWQKNDATACERIQPDAKHADKDIVTDTVIGIDKGMDTDILLEKETKENLGNSDFEESVKTPEPEKEKKVAPKKENPKAPDLAEFLEYAKQTYQNELKRDFSPFEFAVRSKYESWINADWKDGNGKQIKNWKSKLNNTIPHLKPIYNGTNNYTAGAANGNYQKPGKTSARTVLAQRLNAANAANSESGNITIDIEAQ